LIALIGVTFGGVLSAGSFVWGPDSMMTSFIKLKQELPGAFTGHWRMYDGIGHATGPVAFTPYLLRFSVSDMF
jgi:hypothetical protein